MRTPLLLSVAALIGGCANQAPIEKQWHQATVGVSAGCVVDPPAPPTALRDQMSRAEWDALTLRQKANRIGAQAIYRKTYGDELATATAACPVLK